MNEVPIEPNLETSRRAVEFGKIAFAVAEPLEPFYRELSGLLGVTLEGNLNNTPEGREKAGSSVYSVILADGITLDCLKALQGDPLILICGPVEGEVPGRRLETLSHNLGQEGTRLLMEGRGFEEKDAEEPTLDLMLEEIRRVFRREVPNYWELPPVPWGHAYALVLTHNIDIMSLNELPFSRKFSDYFYRSSVLNWRRRRAGKISTPEFRQAVWEMGRTILAGLGLGRDVWRRALPAMIQMEEQLDVRSGLYFIPYPKYPGILPAHMGKDSDSAPPKRAAHYEVRKYREMILSLEEKGWEAGLHGMDAWHDVEAARREYAKIAGLTGREETGVRSHWLYFQPPESFKILEEGGFLYDATFGFTEIAGFRTGTLQPYHPLSCRTLWELPLHVQDGALLGEKHLNLNREEALEKGNFILGWGKRYGGAVNLLWHNQSFAAPRFWGEVYEGLIKQAKADKAWIAVPRDVIRWFDLRRGCEVNFTCRGSTWQITSTLTDPEQSWGIPPLRIRLHIDPRCVRRASVPYEAGDGYIDFPARELVTLEMEGEN